MARLQAVPDQPRRMIVYVRQSVDREGSISPEVQERTCRDYIAQHGDEVAAVIADVGVSGLKWDKRPGVQRAMKMLADDQADGIVVWRWSRISRRRLHQVVAIDAIEQQQKAIESATEPFDTTTAGGRFGREVMLAAAAFESEQKAETWADAHRRRRENGLPASGGKRFGYHLADKAYTPDPDTGPILVECYQRYLAGQGLQQVADWLNALGLASPRAGASHWSKRGITYMMDAGFAAGLIRDHDRFIPGAHDALIDETTWRRYQAERARRRTIAPRFLHPAWRLAGIVRCGHCGYTMTLKTTPDGTGSHLRCARADCEGRPYPRRATVEDAVRAWLPSVATDVEAEARRQPRAAVKTERDRLARQVARADKALQTLLVDRARGHVPASVFDAAVAELVAERDDAQRRLDESAPQDLTGFAEAAESLIAAWDDGDPAEVNAVARLLVRVSVTRISFGVKGSPGKHQVTVRGAWKRSD